MIEISKKETIFLFASRCNFEHAFATRQGKIIKEP